MLNLAHDVIYEIITFIPRESLVSTCMNLEFTCKTMFSFYEQESVWQRLSQSILNRKQNSTDRLECKKSLLPWYVSKLSGSEFFADVVELDLDSAVDKIWAKKYPTVSEINAMTTIGAHMFLNESMLLEIDGPVVVVGSIRGQFDDLEAIFSKLGDPSKTRYLFLGDIVDRGKFSTLCISLILLYKIKFPRNIYLIRGKHECASINRIYGFYDEMKRHYGLIQPWKRFSNVFNSLPLAAIVSKQYWCVSAGLSPELQRAESLNSIVRPTDVPDQGIITDLLWSEFYSDTVGWDLGSGRSVSYSFGCDVAKTFLKENNLKTLIKTQVVVEKGYEIHDGVVMLFSATNFAGEFENAGAVAVINESGDLSIQVFNPPVTT